MQKIADDTILYLLESEIEAYTLRVKSHYETSTAVFVVD